MRAQGEMDPRRKAAPSSSATGTHKFVPWWERILLGLGTLPAFFGFAGVSILAYPAYNMVLGVNAGLLGVALMIPRIWDAVTDPFMGRISDNTRSRFGRRKPYIVVGALIMGCLFGLLWMPPEGWSDYGKVGYFILLQILFFTAYTIFAVPYTALTYEMTPDYRERNSIMSVCAFFHKAGEFLSGWMLPLAGLLGVMLIAGASDLNRTGIIAVGWIIGLVVMAAIGVLPGLFVRERFRKPIEGEPPISLLGSMRDALKNTAFLILVAVIILNTLSGVLASGIDQYLLVYFMHDGDKTLGLAQKGLLTSGYAMVGFISIPAINWLANRFDKKGALYVVYAMMMVGAVAKWFIFMPGHVTFQLGGMVMSPILLIDPLLCGPMWVAVKILLASMMADICDDDEMRHGQRREGMFGAVFSWLEKMVVSFAFMATGLALTASGFDPNLGGGQPAETFTIMRLFLSGAPGITAFFALIALYFYPIDAARAEETRRTLEARRGSSAQPKDSLHED